ncbi:MAG: tetratricopeptide repeat protein [Rhodocyclales bacterium]|nr:tetratricopeptide repeat protein [Rhodocyclales bacterium]
MSFLKSIFCGRRQPSPDAGDAESIALSQAETAKARGNECLARGELDAAASCYQDAIRLHLRYAEAYNNLGHVRARQRRFAEAELMLGQALALSPDLVPAHFNLGIVAQEQGCFDQALACFDRTVALMPGHSESHWRRGIILNDRGDNEAAIVAYRRAIAIDPNLAEVHVNLGAAYMQLSRYDEAESHCRQALAINQRRMEEHFGGPAGDDRERADISCAINPDYFHAAHWNLALMHLMRGDYETGLAHFERRLHLTGAVPAWATGAQAFMAAYGTERYWRLDEDLRGRTLLVWTEQGLGDSLMMARYLPLLKATGLGRLVVQCDPPLTRLFERMPAVDAVVPKIREVPPDGFHRHCAMTSLPYLLRTRLDSIPNRVPYLAPADDSMQAWAARLSALPGLKVGIAWSGNKNMDRDRWRSMHLAKFGRLLQVPDVTLLSLQKGEPAAQVCELGWPIVDWMDECEDLLDTAALVAGLDLVVTVDTAIVHLAGALGRPVWLLNRHESEWRWMLGRRDSPWYPSLRIFRQPTQHDWEAVVSQVADELAAFAARLSP